MAGLRFTNVGGTAAVRNPKLEQRGGVVRANQRNLSPKLERSMPILCLFTDHGQGT
jgi:hypothetical protein